LTKKLIVIYDRQINGINNPLIKNMYRRTMNNKSKKLISLAISGLIAGGALSSNVFANDDHHDSDSQHEEGKDSCKGKDGCKGHEEGEDHHE